MYSFPSCRWGLGSRQLKPWKRTVSPCPCSTLLSVRKSDSKSAKQEKKFMLESMSNGAACVKTSLGSAFCV